MQEKDNLCLYDSFDKTVQSGKWKIETGQTLMHHGGQVNEETISASQEFVVENDFFFITDDKIMQRTPLKNAQGEYTNLIPHVVLNGAIPSAAGNYMLLLLKKDEITSEDTTAVSDYFTSEEDVLKPDTFCCTEEKLAAKYGTVRITTELFDRIAPRKAELSYLVHYRQVFTGDKPEMNLDADGLFTVILSNRIPSYDGEHKTEYKAFLVTLEGLGDYLDGKMEQDSGCSYVELLAADAWEFTVTGKKAESFRTICSRLKKDSSYDWLCRLPLPDGLQDDSEDDSEKQYAKTKLEKGYVPMLYHTRPGDEGLCFYRSALVPKPVAELSKDASFESADAALCYDAERGIFDTSLAAAFEAGRFAALGDEAYMDALYLFRQAVEGELDRQHTQSLWQIEKDAQSDLAQLMEALDMESLVKQSDESDEEVPLAGDKPTDSRKKTEDFLKEKGEDICQALSGYVEPLAKWLAKLLLLYPVPLENLIPREELLEKESVKFFFLDKNWQSALYDGAVSIGLYSSKQSACNQAVRSILFEETEKQLYEYRAGLYGMEPPQDKQEILSGFLVRAEMTSQWPTTSVSAKDKEGNDLPILRMEHLSQDTMILIFDGIASLVVVNEPEEGIALVFDEDSIQVFRDNSSVLMLEPDKEEGMVRKCAAAQGISANEMGSAAFAKCYLSTGERVVFGEVTDHAESV